MRITTKKFKAVYYSIKRVLKKDEFINEKSRGQLTFGICLLNKFTVSDRNQQVMGDELQARAIVKEVLLHCPEIKRCRIYDIREADSVRDDIVFVMWPDYPILKRKPLKYILWLQNAGFEHRINEFLKIYNYVLSPSKKCCAKFSEVIYMPMACEDPDVFKKVQSDERFKSDVCFVGNFTESQRPTWFQKEFLFPATKYNFGLWGTNWERSGIEEIKKAARGRLDPKDIPHVYSSAKVVLANHCLVHREEGMVTTRIYEALACSSFVISDYFAALDEFRDHIIFSKGGKDLDEKLEYYLSNPEARLAKIEGAREMIVNNHTFRNRVETIARTVGLKFRE